MIEQNEKFISEKTDSHNNPTMGDRQLLAFFKKVDGTDFSEGDLTELEDIIKTGFRFKKYQKLKSDLNLN